MPLTGWVFDAVFISVSMPSYQKPSRSDLSIREVSVLCAGPKGLAGAAPEDFPEPAEYLTRDIFGARVRGGLGSLLGQRRGSNEQENGNRRKGGFHLLSLPSK